jgi:hypothetical protein
VRAVGTSDFEASFVNLLLLHNNDLVWKITECNIVIFFCSLLEFSAKKSYKNFKVYIKIVCDKVCIKLNLSLAVIFFV